MIENLNDEKLTLTITENGNYRYQLNGDICKNCKIQIHKNVNASLMLQVQGTNAHLDTFVTLDNDAQAHILFWNESSESLDMNLQFSLSKDTYLHCGLGDISACEAKYDIHSNQIQQGAQIQLTTSVLSNRKKVDIYLEHDEPHTKSLIKNFAIVEESGNFNIQATGKVNKGAYLCETHQATRVLTLSQNQNAKVLPILLIDENDVKASHATTLGQPDKNQLYYLQSRGLTSEQALALLTKGYLMPICEIIKDEEIQEFIKNELENKVMINV